MLECDRTVGRPSFQLSKDHIATAVDLLCSGADAARAILTGGMLEVPISILVRKSMRSIKSARGLTNIEITGEHELLEPGTDPIVSGRIDIVFRFRHQFGDEDAYLGVECKRVRPGDSSLNGKYVTEGVARFASGRYSAGHVLGMMLGYVLRLPLEDLLEVIGNRLRTTYGEEAAWSEEHKHELAVAMSANVVSQLPSGHKIRLLHIFVDMTQAA